jgi:hypothetical protein
MVFPEQGIIVLTSGEMLGADELFYGVVFTDL